MSLLLNRRLLRRPIFSLYTTSSKFITDIEVPECNKCTHYVPCKYNLYKDTKLATCSKFGVKDIYDGSVQNYYIEHCRRDNTKCGKEGLHFLKATNLKQMASDHDMIHTYAICGIIISGAVISFI